MTRRRDRRYLRGGFSSDRATHAPTLWGRIARRAMQPLRRFNLCHLRESYEARGHHCAAPFNRADKTPPAFWAVYSFLLTRSWLGRPCLCSRVAKALGGTSHHSGSGGHPALGIAAPNIHRFCPGVHVAGIGCTGVVVRVARVQSFIGSPGRRPLPLNRVRRRLCHSVALRQRASRYAFTSPLFGSPGQIWWLQANPMCDLRRRRCLIRTPASPRSGRRL